MITLTYLLITNFIGYPHYTFDYTTAVCVLTSMPRYRWVIYSIARKMSSFGYVDSDFERSAHAFDPFLPRPSLFNTNWWLSLSSSSAISVLHCVYSACIITERCDWGIGWFLTARLEEWPHPTRLPDSVGQDQGILQDVLWSLYCYSTSVCGKVSESQSVQG